MSKTACEQHREPIFNKFRFEWKKEILAILLSFEYNEETKKLEVYLLWHM